MVVSFQSNLNEKSIVEVRQPIGRFIAQKLLGHVIHLLGIYVIILCNMLGSKVLGFYVFRTLICIVGKP